MTNFDDFKLAVEALSGGKNTVRLDDLGMPSVLVAFPRLTYADVISGGTNETLPAFIVNGEIRNSILASKYLNIIVNDRAYSLPLKDPAIGMNFDRALTVCRNKGAGWHLNTNATWAAISLLCKKNDTMPRGNNSYGQDVLNPHQKGVATGHMADATRFGRTATGSGHVSWNHDHTDSGISDLNGNVWEWCSGLRIVDGEIQVITENNATSHSCNMNATSTEWRAILSDGRLVAPGTANTLKWDYTGAPAANTAAIHLIAGNLANKQADESPYGAVNYGAMVAKSGVTVPMILKGLGLFPSDASNSGYANNGHFWFRNLGELLPIRGGTWNDAGRAGVFALRLLNARSLVGTHVGFRAALVE